LYFPVRPESATDHYRQGMLGRLLWESALGLARDPFLEERWREVMSKEFPAPRLRAMGNTLGALEPSFAEGLETAAALRTLFASPQPDRARIQELHGRLAKLGAAFSAAAEGAGMLGRFLQYEMMDLDYSPYPALASELEAKYRGLSERSARFRSALSRLAAA